MNDFTKILVAPNLSIRETIGIIDSSAMQIALVVDKDKHLMGTVTDGDIRRGILNGISLDEAIETVMNRRPITCSGNDPRDTILARMRAKRLRHVPVVDADGRLTGLETLEEYLASRERPNAVVLMAGGLGTRLRPLTENCPKPMLKVGNKPLLETILENFIEYGFKRFHISVNYMADVVKSHFGDGSRWGAEISYLQEDQRLGTAGALSLLPEKPEAPFFVMNGDLLTKVNFGQLLDFHTGHHAQATMCVREYDFQVPYGVVRIDGHRIVGIDEKPVQKFFVNAGIYVLNPDTLALIPKNTFFDMPTLFEKLIESDRETSVFPVREYWLDIGHLEDFQRANVEYFGDNRWG